MVNAKQSFFFYLKQTKGRMDLCFYKSLSGLVVLSVSSQPEPLPWQHVLLLAAKRMGLWLLKTWI